MNPVDAVPITYQTDRARGVIQTRCSGVTTFQEVIEHFRALHADPEVFRTRAEAERWLDARLTQQAGVP